MTRPEASEPGGTDEDREALIRPLLAAREGMRDNEPIWSDRAVRSLLRVIDALRAAPPAERTTSLIGRWSRGGFHAPVCWQAWIDSGGEAGCICSIAR